MSTSLQLETQRLLLRPWKECDRAPFAAINADPEVMTFFAAPMTREESDAAFDRYQMQLERDGFTMLAVEHKPTGAFAGLIGMQTMRDVVPNLQQPAVEIGWRLGRAFQGKGLATEGAQAIVSFAFNKLHLPQLVAVTAVSNTASRRVMEKLGMVHRPDLTFHHPRVPDHHPHQRHVLYSLANFHSGIKDAALQILACLLLVTSLAGCHSQPTSLTASNPAQTVTTYPPQPQVAPPPFKVFHQTANSVTLVTKEDAADDEVIAILYQLRNAAHTRGFDALHVSQKFVDARDPIVWFHLYRGARCASEKYSATLPCGSSYHAAGDYTFGGFTDRNHEEATLFHGEDHETPLWDSNKAHAKDAR